MKLKTSCWVMESPSPVAESVAKQGANTSILFVPAGVAKSGMLEAIEAGI